MIKNNIIFIHNGYNFYLKYSLSQARHSNPDAEIILLGDKGNNKFDSTNIKHFEISQYYNLSNDFKNVFANYSTNGYEFEIFCIQRWLILFEFMKKNNIKNSYVFDSDVMLYSNLDNFHISKKYSAGYCIPENQENYYWAASPCSIYWTIEELEKFSLFIFDCYQNNEIMKKLLEKWQYHEKNNLSGGICDMTLLYLYYLKNKDKIKNFLEIDEDNFTFDYNIIYSDNFSKNEFDYHKKNKNIIFNNKIPTCKSLMINKDISFHSLHFSGDGKNILPFYYTGDNFYLKFKIDWILFKIKEFYLSNKKYLKFLNILKYYKFIKNKIFSRKICD